MNRHIRAIMLLFAWMLVTFVLVACNGFEPGADRTPPVFSGIQNITHVIGDPVPDVLESVTAYDRVDGDVTAFIVSDTSGVDFTTPGIYTVMFTVSDEAGNIRNASMTVTVLEPEEQDTTYEENAALDIAALSWTPGENLPRSGNHGTDFIWVSGNPYVITNRGYVIKPAIGSDPIDVTMLVTAINGTYSTVIEYVVTVEPRQESVVTSKTSLPFTNTSEEWHVGDNPAVDIYYVDHATVPYIDIEMFMMLIDKAIEFNVLEFEYEEEMLTISYTATYTDLQDNVVNEDLWLVLDFDANTLTVNSFNFFSYYIVSTETDYGEGLVFLDSERIESNQVTINLNNYHFDLVIDENDETYLMPLHLANLIFAGDIYYDVYYNGDALIGFDTFSRNDNTIQTLIRSSSLNGTDSSREMREATYHFLALAFDHFYGLKEYQQVETYYTQLVEHADNLIMRSTARMNETLFAIPYFLDDLHTSHAFAGFFAPLDYNPTITRLEQYGPDSQRYITGVWTIQDRLNAKFGSYQNLPGAYLLPETDIAIIYLTSFTVDTPDSFKMQLDLLPSTVQHVVIDLTYNSGGNVGAVWRIFGYMTEEPVLYHSKNPADGSAVTYYIGSEYETYDYHWYIMTSSVTFSAANMMASMAKESGVAPIIGQKSSGGASSIGMLITPVGTGMIMSTNNVTSTRVGDAESGYTYFDIESGVEVDYYMISTTDDDVLATIIAAIHID